MPKKSTLIGLAGAAALAGAALAGPAAAYTGYAKLVNGNSSDATVSGVSWSGSYNPQLPGSVSAGGNATGRLTTVLSAGTSFLDFRATDASGTTCYFSLNISNSSGAITALAARTAGTGSCSASPGSASSGATITFTTSGN